MVAKFVDWRISRRNLPPEIVTRYRVLRRTIFAAIVFLGVMSALLVIPQVRAVAGGVLASGAVLALVIGFASQRTIGNFVAGILIAISQPLRIGDEVEVQGTRGDRRGDRAQLHLDPYPRQRPPRRPERAACLRDDPELDHPQLGRALPRRRSPCPPMQNYAQVVQALGADGDEVYVTDLVGENATVVVRKRVSGEHAVDRASSDLRLWIADRLAGHAG